MPTKRTKRTRKARAQVTPLQYAILTGGPLPDPVSKWDAYRIEHPDSPGLICTHNVPFADIWANHYGKPMSKKDRAAVAARLPEIKAAIRRQHGNATPDGPDASNWPESASKGFRSVATLEGDSNDEQ